MASQLEAFVGKMARKISALEMTIAQLVASQKTTGDMQKVIEALRPPRSVTQDIDAIDGRRIFYNLNGRVAFDVTNAQQRGNPVTMQVSQDGPYIATHYPVITWKPSAPALATNLGRWSPVTSTPLPTQQVGANLDIIDISYELVDGGSQRNFQNEATPPIISRLDNLVPLPVPTLFTPNSVIQVFPTYESIKFAAGAATPTTGGLLVIGFPGYRIVNL